MNYEANTIFIYEPEPERRNLARAEPRRGELTYEQLPGRSVLSVCRLPCIRFSRLVLVITLTSEGDVSAKIRLKGKFLL